MLKSGTIFRFHSQGIQVKNQIGKGKSAYSYMSEFNNQTCVFKLFHDEKHSYYTFDRPKIDKELMDYEVLRHTSINIPSLIISNHDPDLLLKEFIEGPTLALLIANGQITPNHIKEVAKMAKVAKSIGYNLDYFPTNFIASEKGVFYIDYELNPYTDTWNFENWGIYYYFNNNGMRHFLTSGDASKLNEDLHRGIPIKKPFSKQVKEFLDMNAV